MAVQSSVEVYLVDIHTLGAILTQAKRTICTLIALRIIKHNANSHGSIIPYRKRRREALGFMNVGIRS